MFLIHWNLTDLVSFISVTATSILLPWIGRFFVIHLSYVAINYAECECAAQNETHLISIFPGCFPLLSLVVYLYTFMTSMCICPTSLVLGEQTFNKQIFNFTDERVKKRVKWPWCFFWQHITRPQTYTSSVLAWSSFLIETICTSVELKYTCINYMHDALYINLWIFVYNCRWIQQSLLCLTWMASTRHFLQYWLIKCFSLYMEKR